MSLKAAPFGFFALTLCAAAPAFASSPPREPMAPGQRLMQVCPQEWIINRMPRIRGDDGPPPREQYFILNGQRREMNVFDMRWVRRHCRLTPRTVY